MNKFIVRLISNVLLILLFLTSCSYAKKAPESLPQIDPSARIKSVTFKQEINTPVMALAAVIPEEEMDTHIENITPNMPKEKALKVMTYNIRHGLGTDEQLDLERVIDTIKSVDPDIVALNEVDHLMLRSQIQKQDEMIASALGYNLAYGYNINIGGKYGNVLLAKYPIKSWVNHKLPKHPLSEPRGLMEADLDIDGEVLKVMITHLSIKEKERPEQVNFITKKLEEVSQPKILMGDFNNNPSSEIIKQITAVMKDTAIKEYNTFPANNPKKRTDYIFVSDKIKVKSSQSVMSEASDHLPVVAELVLQQTED
ncbi:MAG: hypothetical protein PWP27_2495 [Clostridiales bacterium]|jgi:endonuclease/exonuclease/phosphatase family metal-dependent hydrolase|nr:hypothetical protein [Clostridiales bacterium]MDK2934685.1 hypothetical protein [Clostridiales bacterium]